MKEIWKVYTESFTTTVNRYRRNEAEKKIEKIYEQFTCDPVLHEWTFDTEEEAKAFSETIKPELDIRIESRGCHILVTQVNVSNEWVEESDEGDTKPGAYEYECVGHIPTDKILEAVFPPDDEDEDDE